MTACKGPEISITVETSISEGIWVIRRFGPGFIFFFFPFFFLPSRSLSHQQLQKIECHGRILGSAAAVMDPEMLICHVRVQPLKCFRNFEAMLKKVCLIQPAVPVHLVLQTAFSISCASLQNILSPQMFN
ncbi:hypothetical protein EUGRSUZ_I02125 [Eucalyptus grandis]|uniref:Uncharacterized protein n=2 Tax=Eucalyptus grandis TaxID=71139 RepID=A0A059AR18_EUCGR|nr:hypothetical protein EUGRSUZ_I02125 [Eucalyptus grandis]